MCQVTHGAAAALTGGTGVNWDHRDIDVNKPQRFCRYEINTTDLSKPVTVCVTCAVQVPCSCSHASHRLRPLLTWHALLLPVYLLPPALILLTHQLLVSSPVPAALFSISSFPFELCLII